MGNRILRRRRLELQTESPTSPEYGWPKAPRLELISLLPGGVNGLGETTPSKYFINILADFKSEQAPLQPAAAESYKKNFQTGGRDFKSHVVCR